MTIDRAVTLGSVLLVALVSPCLTGHCPAAVVFKRLGLPVGCAFR